MAIKKQSPQSYNNQPNSSNPAISSRMGEQIVNRDEYYESILEILRVGNDFHQEHPTSEEKDELNSDDELICLEQLTILQQQPIEFPQVSKLTQDCSPKTMQENVRIYWNSLNLDEKQDYLQMGISDLLSFSKKFLKAEKLLKEALSLAEVHEKWDFWVCCCCNEKFTDSESHFEHIVGTHLKCSLPEETSLIFPLRVNENWVSMINNGNWEPADTHAVFTVLEKKLALPSESCRKREKVPKSELTDYDPKGWVNGSFFGGSWPISDDFGRRACLKTIQFWLKEILRKKHFLAIHLDHVINQAMDKLQSEFRVGSLWDLGLHQSHLCICLLGDLELQGILRFLKKTCSKVSEETSVMNAILNLSTLSLDTKEMFVLKNKSLYLLWDKHLDSFLSWIFSGPSNEKHVELWAHLREKRILSGIKELIDFGEVLKERKEELVASDNNSCTNNLQLSKKDEWILQVAEDINQFEFKINSVAAVDYREILSFLVKSYIKIRLEENVRNDTVDKSGNDATDKPNDGGGGRDSSGENFNVGADQSKEDRSENDA